MINNNKSDDIFGSLKSIVPNNNAESIDKIGFENQFENQFNQLDEDEDSNELLNNSDILSISKSSSLSKNEKQNQIKDISNIQFSFSNISDLDRKIIFNEAEEKEKEELQEEFNVKEISISTNSIKMFNNANKKLREGNSFTPSTLCNYYQHSNEVTPIQNENKYNLFNPVNIHQVNLNLIYNNMNNTEDSSLIKSASNKAASQLKYTKAQCNNINSNEGHIQALPEVKANTFLISNNDNIEYIIKGNKPINQNSLNKNRVISITKPKRKEMLIKENVIQLSLETNSLDTNTFSIYTPDTINILNVNNKNAKEGSNVYFNGLRFGIEGESNNPFSLSTSKKLNTNNIIKEKEAKSKKSLDVITPKDTDKNINYNIRNVKTESTTYDSHTPKESDLNTIINPHIPSFTHSKKVKEIITDLINKSKSTSKPKSNSNFQVNSKKNSNRNLARNFTLTSRNVKQDHSLKKHLSNQIKQKLKKALSNGKNGNKVNDCVYKKIIKGIKNKAPESNSKEHMHNIRPVSYLFNSNLNANSKKSATTNNNKANNKPHQKVNTQINLASILGKFEPQPKKRIEQSSRQSTLCTFLNDTILNNKNSNQINDTFSKIILHTQETNITTETNTNTNPYNNDHNNVNQTIKYGANSSIASIKKVPKVIQNFSCYKKKNSFQSHFVSKEEIEISSISKGQPVMKSLKLKKLEGDDDFSITDE